MHGAMGALRGGGGSSGPAAAGDGSGSSGPRAAGVASSSSAPAVAVARRPMLGTPIRGAGLTVLEIGAAAAIARPPAAPVALSQGAASSTSSELPPWQQMQFHRAAAVAGFFRDPSAVADARSPAGLTAPLGGAVPKHSLQRAAAMPFSYGRKRNRLVPNYIRDEFADGAGDLHRLPWNAMIVSIGHEFGTRRIASANDMGDFLVAGSAGVGRQHGHQVGARASAVAELRRSVPPLVESRPGSATVGLAVDIAFAEDAACDHVGASSARVAVVATSSCQLGDCAGTIGKFIADVGAEFVVMLDNGPVAGATGSSPPRAHAAESN